MGRKLKNPLVVFLLTRIVRLTSFKTFFILSKVITTTKDYAFISYFKDLL